MCNCRDKPRSVVASLASDERYESAIATRNLAWVAYLNASDQLHDAIDASVSHDGLKAFRAMKNTALDTYERAEYELLRIKTWRKRDARYQDATAAAGAKGQ